MLFSRLSSTDILVFHYMLPDTANHLIPLPHITMLPKDICFSNISSPHPPPSGMFVMKTGICQRPPLQWPQEVLAAGVCFPYILTLQPQVLSVYSAVDQQCKQTVSLSGAKGLLCTSGEPVNINPSPNPAQITDRAAVKWWFCFQRCRCVRLSLH